MKCMAAAVAILEIAPDISKTEMRPIPSSVDLNVSNVFSPRQVSTCHISQWFRVIDCAASTLSERSMAMTTLQLSGGMVTYLFCNLTAVIAAVIVRPR